MAFVMALPHSQRVKQVSAEGQEELPHNQQQWDLYREVQRSIKASAAGAAAAGDAEAEDAGGQQPAPEPPNPQRVLERLATARGELDVIIDLINEVEQQQAVAVQHVHAPERKDPAEVARAKALRLAARQAQLRGAAERLRRGGEALRAQRQRDAAFLHDLAQLRARWRLRRLDGPEGAFYVDLTLPLRVSAAQAVVQEGAHCTLVQDSTGACMIDAARQGGPPRVLRGWQQIDSALQQRLQLLGWRVVGGLLGREAQHAQHEKDGDGGVAALRQLAAAAAARCGQEAAARAVGGSGTADGTAMEVDGDGGASDASKAGAAAAALPSSSTALLERLAAGIPLSMLTPAAVDIQAVQLLPGFQLSFEAEALRLLAQLLQPPGSTGTSTTPGKATQQQGVLLEQLLRWLRHAALKHSVSILLWRAAARSPATAEGTATAAVGAAAAAVGAGPGLSVAPVAGLGEARVAAWQLQALGQLAPAVLVVEEDAIRLEGRLGPAKGPPGTAAILLTASSSDDGQGGMQEAVPAAQGLTRKQLEALLAPYCR